ncbi:DUF4214 domain-containing protein [Cupriavidus gilardii]|uniref:DUF4214 domain-containing protein n=1 Tax=Cupriavidus gilardii TaxID=82541 RepID=UPI0009E9E7E4|nr:DUF4214 domain-containing protein [Cupriavidus gilardii]
MSFGVAAAAIGAAGAIGSAVIGGRAAKKAGQAQADAANRQLDLQWDMYQQQREDQAPWRNTGGAALNQLAYLLGIQQNVNPAQAISDLYQTYLGRKPDESGFQNYMKLANSGMSIADIERSIASSPEAQDAVRSGRVDAPTVGTYAQQYGQQQSGSQPSGAFGSLLRGFTEQDFKTDPGYEFRLGEGQKALESSAAARGGLLSGAAAKAMTKYSQNFASNEYQNAYNRFTNDQTNTFNRLAGIAGVGQTATNQLGQAGQNYANQAGNAIKYGGTARGSGYINQANAIYSGLGSLAGIAANTNWGAFGSGASAPSGIFGTVGGMNGVSPVTGMNSGVGYSYSPYSSFGGTYG